MNNTQNTAAIAEFEQQAPAPRSVGAELVSSREAQEVQVAMVAAKRFPRDAYTAYNRIMQDCKRRTLAEKSMYEFTRGGSTVTGPSIHLAKAIARSWGNLDSGFKVLEQSAKESTVMAYCWDLETNYRETKVFTVQHVREMKKGSYLLTDSRDIYETIANHAVRRERSCILSVIPQDIVDAAVGQCNATLSSLPGDGKNGKITKEDAVRDIISRFYENYGVSKDMLETYIGRKAEAFTIQSVNRLRGVYTALQDGTASVEQYFDMSAAAPVQDKPQEEQEAPAQQEEQVSLDDV